MTSHNVEPKPRKNLIASFAIFGAIASLFVIPIILGPLAVVCGVVGYATADQYDGEGRPASLLGAAIGLIATIIVLVSL